MPEAEFGRLAAHLELVPLRLGETLHEPGCRLPHVHFPHHLDRVAAARPGVRHVGRSRGGGQRGRPRHRPVSWAGTPRPPRPSCKTAAMPYRLDAKPLREELDRAGPVCTGSAACRYTQALVTQIFQSGACNRAPFEIEQQLCRWLLLTLDRMPSNELIMTPGADRRRARRAPGRHHRGRRGAAGRRLHPLPARPTSRCSTGRDWRHGPASATTVRQDGVRPPALRRAPHAARPFAVVP